MCVSFVCVQIGSHIKKQVGELGFSCTGLVTKAGALQCSPNDSFTKKELIEGARKVSEKVPPHLTSSTCSVTVSLLDMHQSNVHSLHLLLAGLPCVGIPAGR